MWSYLTLVLCIVLLPVIYCGTILLLRSSFPKEENKTRKPLSSGREIVVMLVSELTLLRFWFARDKCDLSDIMFDLVFLMLAAMTILCMIDLWERIVPNKVLLVLLLLYIITVGFFGVYDMEIVIGVLPSIILGFLFCAISFGLGYILAHRNLGAGDVKLSLVMGLYLTGEYVVGAILYGCIIGAVFSITQIIRKKMSRKDTIPFVPFLYIGLIIRCLIG